jgi:hypothetical protein
VIVLDTGVLFAAIDRRDGHHRACAELLRERTEDLVVLPAPVLVETAWLVQSRLGAAAEAALVASVAAGDFTLHDLSLDDWARVRELVMTYADMDLGVVDASVVVAAERYGCVEVATLNHRDFTVVRPRHVGALTLLPRDR